MYSLNWGSVTHHKFLFLLQYRFVNALWASLVRIRVTIRFGVNFLVLLCRRIGYILCYFVNFKTKLVLLLWNWCASFIHLLLLHPFGLGFDEFFLQLQLKWSFDALIKLKLLLEHLNIKSKWGWRLCLQMHNFITLRLKWSFIHVLTDYSDQKEIFYLYLSGQTYKT